jgi:hypothetical protein
MSEGNMNMINRELTDDCYLEYKPEWTTDVFRWHGGDYVDVGNIDTNGDYSSYMSLKGIAVRIQTTELPKTYLSILKNFCIDWHESQ